eukprot:1176246-Pleurochrysis_carterae.AAC.1
MLCIGLGRRLESFEPMLPGPSTYIKCVLGACALLRTQSPGPPLDCVRKLLSLNAHRHSA